MTQSPLSDTHGFTMQELPSTSTLMFTFQVDEQSRQYNYQQAFALGHSYVIARKFDLASVIFEKLASVTDRGPRAHILLAVCKAGLSDYKGARAVLDSVFRDQLAILAAAIHEVIVENRMGFKDEALRDLVELVNEHKELPTLSLWLGDLLEAHQRRSKAIQCWKLAIKRDRSGGAVALAAQLQLKRVQES